MILKFPIARAALAVAALGTVLVTASVVRAAEPLSVSNAWVRAPAPVTFQFWEWRRLSAVRLFLKSTSPEKTRWWFWATPCGSAASAEDQT